MSDPLTTDAHASGLSRVLLWGGALLFVNSAYLAAFATPSLFYFANVALHVVLGAALFVAGLPWLRRWYRSLTPLDALTAVLLGAGSVLGLVLTVTGATSS